MSPVELRLGVVDFWSPKAAKQALWLEDDADGRGRDVLDDRIDRTVEEQGPMCQGSCRMSFAA